MMFIALLQKNFRAPSKAEFFVPKLRVVSRNGKASPVHRHNLCVYYNLFLTIRGTRWRSWLVAGSNPDGVIGISH